MIKELTHNDCIEIMGKRNSNINIPATLFEVYWGKSSRGIVVKTPRGYRILEKRKKWEVNKKC